MNAVEEAALLRRDGGRRHRRAVPDPASRRSPTSSGVGRGTDLVLYIVSVASASTSSTSTSAARTPAKSSTAWHVGSRWSRPPTGTASRASSRRLGSGRAAGRRARRRHDLLIPMTVDIFIPFWGDPELLHATVRSVLAQDDDDWRLTVVDDCYPDPTVGPAIEASTTRASRTCATRPTSASPTTTVAAWSWPSTSGSSSWAATTCCCRATSGPSGPRSSSSPRWTSSSPA